MDEEWAWWEHPLYNCPKSDSAWLRSKVEQRRRAKRRFDSCPCCGSFPTAELAFLDDDEEDQDSNKTNLLLCSPHESQFSILTKNHHQLCTTFRSFKAPSIALWFDDSSNSTIAQISGSCPLYEPFQRYLCDCVKKGQAVQLDPRRYQLEGFLRPHWTALLAEDGIYSSMISVHPRALESSDASYSKLHFSLKSHNNNKYIQQAPFDRLEEMLDIVRLHRMQDDLDLFSMYCMMQASKAMCKVAARMAARRIQEARLCLTPYTDGCIVSGWSRFVRYNHHHDDEDEPPDNNDVARATTAIHYEGGQPVEYVQCDSAELIPTTTAPAAEEDAATTTLVRQHQVTLEPRHPHEAEFTWSCEEMVFANLGRPLFVPVREYEGQKVTLGWRPGETDASVIQMLHRRTAAAAVQPQPPPQPPLEIKLSEFRLELTPKCGVHSYDNRRSRVTLRVLASKTSQADEVTVRYSGRVRILQVKVNLQALVRAMAMAMEPVVQAQCAKAKETRPLTEEEEAYLRQVQRATRL